MQPLIVFDIKSYLFLQVSFILAALYLLITQIGSLLSSAS